MSFHSHIFYSLADDVFPLLDGFRVTKCVCVCVCVYREKRFAFVCVFVGRCVAMSMCGYVDVHVCLSLWVVV